MKSIILFALLSFQAASTEPPHLAGLGIKLKGFSTELEIMVEQLAKSKNITFGDSKEIANAALIANADLSKAPKANALFLIKSEIYKSLLNNSLVPQKSNLALSSSLINSLNEKLKKHELIYAPFSKWIIGSINIEIGPYITDGLIDKYQSVSGNDINARKKAMELERLAKYLGPWILEFLDRTPEDFNLLTDQVAASSIKSLARKGFYFAQFADDYSSSMGEELFIVPTLKDQSKATKIMPVEKSLKKIKAERLEKGSKDVQKIGPNSGDPSSVIDQLLNSSEKEQLDDDKNTWKPR